MQLHYLVLYMEYTYICIRICVCSQALVVFGHSCNFKIVCILSELLGV